MLGRLFQWLIGRSLQRLDAGRPPTSRSFSLNSKSYSMPAPTTTHPAPGAVIKDAGISFSKPLKKLVPSDVLYVVVHHTANANPHWGIKECHAWHKDGMGWSGCGYNYLVEQNGAAYYGRADEDFDFVGSHVAGWNSRSVGVCLAGNYDSQTPTEANLDVVARVVAMLLHRYGLTASAIRYHSDLAEKSCPGSKFPPRAEFAKRVARFMD